MLHDRIKFWRQAAGLTQEELGERIGVTQGAVSRWERGEAPHRSRLDALIRALELTQQQQLEFYRLFVKAPRLSA